jgi:hypothetical protein
MHYSLDAARFTCSVHEIAHAFLAHECGFPVEAITVDDRRGCARVRVPFSADEFGQAYAESPIEAVHQATVLLATARAGSYIGEAGAPSRGDDLREIEAWHKAIVGACGPEAWAGIYAEAVRGLQAWARHASVRVAIGEMAKALCDQGTINPYGFQTLLGVVDASACPAPYFAPVIPPAQPATPPAVPAQAFSRPVQRRLEAQAGGIDEDRLTRIARIEQANLAHQRAYAARQQA